MSRRLDILAVGRQMFDRMTLAAQGRAWLHLPVSRLRRLAAWTARTVLPPKLWRRREIEAAQLAMQSPPADGPGPRVLLISHRAWTTHTALEMTIGQALRFRGARVEVFYCGGGLPICEMGWPWREGERPCRFCGPFVASVAGAGQFSRTRLTDLVPETEQKSVFQQVEAAEHPDSTAAELAGLDVAALVRQSHIWYFRSSNPRGPAPLVAYRHFLAGGVMMTIAARRLIAAANPDVVLMVNGLFFEERIIREVASTQGVRTVTYEFAAQRGTLFLTSGERPAPEYDIESLWSLEGKAPLTSEQDRRLHEVLEGRARGAETQRRYFSMVRTLPPGWHAPTFTLFSNVTWDTAVTGKSTVFASLQDWAVETIRLIQSRPHLSLVVRIHPAESRIPGKETNEPLVEAISDAFPDLPPNVRVIPPEDPIHSYELIRASKAILAFSSTVGLEAAALGKPVCLVGERHYRGKGFTVDPAGPEEYAALFDNLSWTVPDTAKSLLARKYAYLFFCRAMLPFRHVAEIQPGEPRYQFDSVNDLAPGTDPVLDLICDGILHDRPFVLPEPQPLGTKEAL